MFNKIKTRIEKENPNQNKENQNLQIDNKGVLIECNLLDNNNYNLEIK